MKKQHCQLHNRLLPCEECEIARLTAELADQKQSSEQENKTLRAELAAGREALKFYADPQTYGLNGGTIDRVIFDAGKTARQYLSSPSSADKLLSLWRAAKVEARLHAVGCGADGMPYEKVCDCDFCVAYRALEEK